MHRARPVSGRRLPDAAAGTGDGNDLAGSDARFDVLFHSAYDR